MFTRQHIRKKRVLTLLLHAVGVLVYFSLIHLLIPGLTPAYLALSLAGCVYAALVLSNFLSEKNGSTDAPKDTTRHSGELLHCLPVAAIAVDGNGAIRTLNTRAETLLNIHAAELTGKNYKALPQPIHEAIEATLDTGRPQQHEFALNRPPDGVAYLTLETEIYRRDDDPASTVVLAVLIDTTSLRQLQNEMRNVDRLAAVGVLAAGLAHEIKNPLVSIKTFAQLLPEKFDDAEFREDYANIMVNEVDRIDKIVNRLLTLSRPVEYADENVEINALLEHVLTLFLYELDKRAISVRKQLAAELPPVRGNAELLTQLLINLVINAMEALESKPQQHGRELSLSSYTGPAPPPVRPEAETNGRFVLDFSDRHTAPPHAAARWIVVEVADTGPGIPPDKLHCIFEPFYTTHRSGQGLGLAIVKNIVQDHRGIVEVSTGAEKGTRFRVYFPESAVQ